MMINSLRCQSLPAIAAVTFFLFTGTSPSGLLAQSPDRNDYANDQNIQGEYQGELEINDDKDYYGLQVVALGNGRFNAVRYKGGLPGAGWNAISRYQIQSIGQTQRNGFVLFAGDDYGDALIADKSYELMNPRGKRAGELKKTERTSSTTGKKPPAGAVVLFDGNHVNAWKNGELSTDKFLLPGTTSLQSFGDHYLHLEYKLPFEPQARRTSRGNSGIFVQGRWEIQILDSFGQEPLNDDCGSIHSVRAPELNMCLPPTSWQTFDIQFTAATYNELAQFRRPARITVWHNGVKIHNDFKLPNQETDGAPVKVGPSNGPLFLSDEGDKVQFRNIWIDPQ